MKTHYILLFAFLSLFSFQLIGQDETIDSLENNQNNIQNPQLDSLQKLILTLPDDTTKINVYRDIAFLLYNLDPDKCLVYCDTLLALSQNLNYKRGISGYYYYTSIAYYVKGDYDKALEQAAEAIKIFETENDKRSKVNIALMNDFMGSVLLQEGSYQIALEKYHAAAKVNEALNDTLSQGINFNNIGNLLLEIGDLEAAKKYYLRALDCFIPLQQNTYTSVVFSSLNRVENDNEKRLSYLNQSLEYALKSGNEYYLIGTYDNFASLFADKENWEKAIEYSRKSYTISNKIGAIFNVGATSIALGHWFSEINEKDSSFFYLKKGIQILEDNDISRKTEDGFKLLAKYYADNGNFDLAYKHLMKGQEVQDSLASLELKKQAQINADKFEFEKNERQIAQQKLQIAQQTNTRNKILIGGGLTLFLLAFIFQRYYYHQKRKKQAAEAELLQEKKEAEKLRELDRLKSTFFTNISHELRTPLTLVAAPLADALQEVKPSPLKNHLELANSNTQKLLRLVNEILDLSKLEAGKIEAKLAETHLLQTVRRIFYAFESIAQIRGLQLQFNTNIPKDLKAFLDVEKFEKILNNLMANAVKFTEKGGTISLNAKHENGQFLFEVIDTGMGISEEELPKVFDRFYQSTDEKVSMQGGTGIGLSLAKELANLMKGDLKVASKIGEGSSFKLEIPLDLVDAEKPISDVPRQEEIVIEQNTVEAKPIYQPILFNGQKPKILIVEDNEEMSEYLSGNLSKNYQITKAFDGLEALEKLEKERFDLITCDVMMLNLDGFSFREKLMKNEVWRQIPFVMLTARAMEADKLKGLRLGVDDYLTKPFNFNELEARLHNLLGNKIAREHYQKEVEEIEKKPLSHEEQLIKTAEEFVLKKIDDTQLRVDDLAKALNLSSRHLSRTMTKIIGISPVNFILEIRLQKARQLLESRQFLTVSEVRYEIGIESASYFTKKFTERFGKNPKEYLE